MKSPALILATVLVFPAAGAIAQSATTGTPSGAAAGAAAATQGPAAAGPANSGGVIPPVPPVQEPAVAPGDAGQAQPGSPATGSREAVVTPPFPPATPGVAIKDVPTNATVGSSTSDQSLRDSVATALANDSQLHGARINVLVTNGAVTLSGTALDAKQASRARAVAEGLAGAARVSAHITTAG